MAVRQSGVGCQVGDCNLMWQSLTVQLSLINQFWATRNLLWAAMHHLRMTCHPLLLID